MHALVHVDRADLSAHRRHQTHYGHRGDQHVVVLRHKEECIGHGLNYIRDDDELIAPICIR